MASFIKIVLDHRRQLDGRILSHLRTAMPIVHGEQRYVLVEIQYTVVRVLNRDDIEKQQLDG